MKNRSLYVFLIAVLLLNGCVRLEKIGHHHIFITNNSDSDIYVDAEICYPEYPDVEFIQYGIVLDKSGYRLAAHSSGDCLPMRGPYESIFDKYDTLVVFYIDAAILDSLWQNDLIGHDSNRYQYLNDLMVLKREYLTYSDLNNKNWSLTYP